MVKQITLEMSEGTYTTLWNAIVKAGNTNALSLLKDATRLQSVPVRHYTIAKDLLFGFVDDIIKSGDMYHANMILKNCRKEGYHYNHYTF